MRAPEREGLDAVGVLKCTDAASFLVGRIEGEEGGIDGKGEANILYDNKTRVGH